MKSFINRRGSKAATRALKRLGTPRRKTPVKTSKKQAVVNDGGKQYGK